MYTFKFRLLSIFMFASLLLAAFPASQARARTTIIYVKQDAPGPAHDGSSWGTAYLDLQSALSAVTAGDTFIWVAQGVYKPTTGTDRNATFQLPNQDVVIYGGFLGTESDPNLRNAAEHVTTLSGDIGTSAASDNVYHVVTGNTGRFVTLDGFTITAGRADDTASPHNSGGGIYFENRNATGLTLQNVIFLNNFANASGGGLYRRGTTFAGFLSLANVTFRNNTAPNGAGLATYGEGSVLINDVLFENNTATTDGGGIYKDGTGTMEMTRSTLVGNYSTHSGGGLYNAGGTVTIVNSTFYNNDAGDYGGGIYNAATLNVSFSTFAYHSAGDTGSGFYSASGDATLTNTILANSTSGVNCYFAGGTLSTDHNLVETDAGGMYACGAPVSGDPHLGLLQDNGGQTWTAAISADSPARDAADDAACPATDQRGVARRQGSHCDIGAFEYVVEAGIYDDTHAAWKYTGTWTSVSGSGPYNNTRHYTSTVGDYAELTFTGIRFTLTFTRNSDRGSISVLVDGDEVGTINADNPTLQWQQTYSGHIYSPRVHTVRLVHGGGGTYIDIDAIQIHDPVPAGMYDDTNSNWVYHGNWTALTASGAYNNTTHYTATSAESTAAEFGFYGTRFALFFKGDTNRGMIRIRIDNGVAESIISSHNTAVQWQQSWISPRYSRGYHKVAVMYFSDYSGIEIDAIQISDSVDTLVPAAISPLTATPGTVSGTVNLSWNAVGNDGMVGTASAYQVRFSRDFGPISNEERWAWSTPVITGIPTPTAPGSPQNMTVSGLVPGELYHFSVRAQDEGLNLSAVNNASAIAGGTGPAGAGTYEDTDSRWVYSTGWSTYTGAGPSGNNSHYTGTIGNSVEFAFTGTRFVLNYVRYSTYGSFDVFVDGTRITTINANHPTLDWNEAWASPYFSAGTHTIRLVHVGPAGRNIDLDYIQILDTPPPPPAGPGLYEDIDSHWTYSSGWSTYTGAGPSSNNSHYTGTIGNSAEFTFTGTRFILNYVRYPTYGSFDVFVDGTRITTINSYNPTQDWDESWNSPAFPAGTHTIRLVHAGPAGRNIELDYIRIPDGSSMAPPGSYKDTDSNWIYSTGWTAYKGSGPTGNTSHYTGTMGSYAEFGFTGMRFILTYAKHPNYGSIDVYVDGTKVETIDTSNPTMLWRATWASPGYSMGAHTVRFVHAGPEGKYIDLDAIQILDTPPPTPVGAGTYEDNNSSWNYSGSGWTQYNGSGPSADNSHYTRTIGDSAELTFTGLKFILTYTKHSSYGAIDVYVDGTKIKTINSYSPTLVWRATWASPTLASGTHTVRLVHAGPKGKYIDLDAIEILDSAALPPGTYDDADGNWTYSSGWTAYTTNGPLNNTGHYTGTVGNSAELTFRGSSFILTYATYSNYGSIDVYVDGVKIKTLDTHSSTLVWRVEWTPSETFDPAVDHTLRLEHAGTGTYIDIDAVTILP